jgi:hypothetical protein
MASAAPEAAVASLRGNARGDEGMPQDGATTAWFWALPCAVLAAVAIVVLGPPLGGLLLPAHNPYTFVLHSATGLHLERTEQARYLVAICVPLLAALGLAAAPTRLARLPERAVGPVVVATQLVVVGVVVASIVAQYRYVFGLIYTSGFRAPLRVRYFTPATLIVATVLAASIAGALRSDRVRQRMSIVLLGESRAHRLAIAGLATLATAIWLLHAVHSDLEIGNALSSVRNHLGFTYDETFAVLNGRTPLVNFTTQYGSLWPFVIALPMLAFGKTLLTFTIAACSVSALALLAVFGVLRRSVRSATAALLLYLPFLATSLFMNDGTLQDRSSPATYFGSFPLRYALPYLVAWMAARRIERSRGPRTDWLLFTVAGLAMLNNTDFGVAAFGASIAAILWAERPTKRSVLRLAVCAAAGIATALGLVALLTLSLAGSLPQLGRLVSYARLYAVAGYALMPIPGVLGIHLLIYLTYVAAILVATVRALRDAENRILTGMLVWSGVFGLGTGPYWVGRSHPLWLVNAFSAWGLALALLTAVAIRELQARRLRSSAIGAFVVLFGFGVMACSLGQTPTPWEQLARLRAPFVATALAPDANPLAPSPRASVRRFVASLADGRSRFVVREGAPVAILLTNGHRIADAYGVVNVAPYTGILSMPTRERIEETVAALRRAGGNTIILPDVVSEDIVRVLSQMGFYVVAPDGLRPIKFGEQRALLMLWPGIDFIFKLVDMRHLHPRALERPAEAAQP